MTGRPALAVIAVVTAGNALGPLALQILVPALPAIRETFAVTIADTQWTISAYSVAVAVAMLIYGRLADTLPRRPLLIGGLILFCAASLGAYFAASLWILVTFRVFQAIGVGAAAIIARAVAADLYQGDELGRVLSYMTMGLVIGPMLAPAIAGYLVVTASWRSILLVLLGLGVIITALTVRYMPVATADPQAGEASTGPVSMRPFFMPGFVGSILIMVSIQVGVYAFITASPYLVIDVYGRTATVAGLVFVYLTFGYLAGNWLAARTVRRFGAPRLLRFATLIHTGGALALLGVAFQDNANMYAVVAPAGVLTLANGIAQPMCMANTLSAVPRMRGRAAGITGFAQIMAGAIGAQTIGYLQGETVLPAAAVVGICAVLTWAGVVTANR